MPMKGLSAVTSNRPPSLFEQYMNQQAPAGSRLEQTRPYYIGPTGRPAPATPALRQGTTPGAPQTTAADLQALTNEYSSWAQQMKLSSEHWTDQQIAQSPQFAQFQQRILSAIQNIKDPAVLQQQLANQDQRDQQGNGANSPYAAAAAEVRQALTKQQAAISSTPTAPAATPAAPTPTPTPAAPTSPAPSASPPFDPNAPQQLMSAPVDTTSTAAPVAAAPAASPQTPLSQVTTNGENGRRQAILAGMQHRFRTAVPGQAQPVGQAQPGQPQTFGAPAGSSVPQSVVDEVNSQLPAGIQPRSAADIEEQKFGQARALVQAYAGSIATNQPVPANVQAAIQQLQSAGVSSPVNLTSYQPPGTTPAQGGMAAGVGASTTFQGGNTGPMTLSPNDPRFQNLTPMDMRATQAPAIAAAAPQAQAAAQNQQAITRTASTQPAPINPAATQTASTQPAQIPTDPTQQMRSTQIAPVSTSVSDSTMNASPGAPAPQAPTSMSGGGPANPNPGTSSGTPSTQTGGQSGPPVGEATTRHQGAPPAVDMSTSSNRAPGGDLGMAMPNSGTALSRVFSDQDQGVGDSSGSPSASPSQAADNQAAGGAKYKMDSSGSISAL